MRNLCAVLVLGLFLGAAATPVQPVTRRLMCDSPEVEEAANSALEHINSHHKYGFKYALNRIEDVKVMTPAAGGEVYILELDLLQTTCHALDPTPLANCTVRPKAEMTVEGDCDVAVAKAADGTFTLKAFKCKAEPDSREDFCAGCPELLPLNHTEGLQMVALSVAIINNQPNRTTQFTLLEVLRLTSQVISGSKLEAEFVLVETNCSGDATEGCTPLSGPETDYALCKSSAFRKQLAPDISCKILHTAPAPVAPPETTGAAAAGNATAGDAAAEGVPAVPPPQPHPILPLLPHGGMHYKMIPMHLHDPSGTGLLSESKESGEVPVVKREAPAVPPAEGAPPLPMGPGIQLCPGRIRHF